MTFDLDAHPPANLGFGDEIIGLDRWPTCLCDYFFDDHNGVATLFVEIAFDRSPYDSSATLPPRVAGDDSDWLKSAKADRETYARLRFQLTRYAAGGAPGFEISLESSLDGGRRHRLAAAAVSTIHDFIVGAYDFLDKLVESGVPAERNGEAKPPKHIRLMAPAELSPELSDIFPVEARFVIARPVGAALSSFRDYSPALISKTPLRPRRTRKSAGAKPSERQPLALDDFVRRFEAAYDGPDCRLKLTTDAGFGNEMEGSYAAQDRDAIDLWAIRFAKPGGTGLGYEIVGGPYFFAPPPLSTSSLSYDVSGLKAFDPERGLIDAQVTTFTGIDMDSWGRNVLQAIDRLLSPEYAVPLATLDAKLNTSWLERIGEVKRALVNAIADCAERILGKPAGDESGLKAGREALRRQLLVRLDDAYQIAAIVTYDVEVDVPVSEAGSEKPSVLHGSPRFTANLSSATASETQGNFAAGSFEIRLDARRTFLTYAVSVADPARQRRIKLYADYIPDDIEHDIGKKSGTDDDGLSSPLRFLSPGSVPALNGTTPLAITIPVILRAYPFPPTLRAQQAVPVNPRNSEPEAFEDARRWRYRAVYATANVAQDTLYGSIAFNAPEVSRAVPNPPATGKKSLSLPGDNDLFALLARFVTAYPAIAAVFESDLQQVDADARPHSEAVLRAERALAAFHELVEGLDSAWKCWQAPDTRSPMRAASPQRDGTALIYAFKLEETDHQLEGDDVTQPRELLKVVLTPDACAPDRISMPGLHFEGYTPRSVNAMPSSVAAAIYCDDRTNIYLTKEMADRTVERTLQFPADLNIEQIRDLDILQFQSVRTSLGIVRNEDLSGAPDNPTQGMFVYATPSVSFASELVPMIDSDRRIDIAKIPSGTPERRLLAEHISGILATIFAGSRGSPRTIELKCNYMQPVGVRSAADELEMKLPVLLCPPTDYSDKESGALAHDLAEAIDAWFLAQGIIRQRDGRLVFDVTVFPAGRTSPPLLRLRCLSIGMQDIADVKLS